MLRLASRGARAVGLVVSCLSGVLAAPLAGLAADAGGDASLVGRWVHSSERLSARLELRPDASCIRTIVTAAGDVRLQGTYRVSTGELAILPPGESEPLRLRLVRRAPDRILLGPPGAAGLEWLRAPSDPSGVAPGNPLAGGGTASARQPSSGAASGNPLAGGGAASVPPSPPPDARGNPLAGGGAAAPAAGRGTGGGVRFRLHRCLDEKGIRHRTTGQPLEVFRLLVPEGWTFSGGVRWITQEKPANQLSRTDLAMPARGDWTVSSADRHCVLRAYPDERWVDLSSNPYIGGMFPAGANYGGMTVQPVPSAVDYIRSFVIPRQRGLASGVRVVRSADATRLSRLFEEEQRSFARAMGAAGLGSSSLTFPSGSLTIDYEESGRPMRETFVCVLQVLRTEGSAMWWPRINYSTRCPRSEEERWTPVFGTMVSSIRINTRWLVRYAAMTDKTMEGIRDVDAYCAKIDREIAEHRSATNSQITREMYPVLAPWHDHRGPDGKLYYLDPHQKHSMNERGDIISGDRYVEEPGWKPMAVHVPRDPRLR